ncbi:MAG TPA: YihY/virulence factor BrkB family protein [Terriglobia bacterium]|nr:YihY/virulence factor BrkB family protein [Terriglobia bacterium]
MAPHSDITLSVGHRRQGLWKSKLAIFGRLSLRAVELWSADRALSMGASLAFYTIFSMAPLLLIAISIAGFFFGNDVAREAVVEEFRLLAGASAARSVDAMLVSASHFGSGVVGITIGICTFLVSATAAFIELQDDLNAILRAPPPKISKYWTFLRQRVISFAMIVAIGFLLMVSLAFDAAISAFGHYFQLDVVAILLAILTLLVNAMMSIILFALIFKVLPNADLSWRAVLGGAIFTAILFILGKFLIGLYLGQSHVASTYGAAASLITILLWVYYSSQILLIGAEFIAAFTGRRESDDAGQLPRRLQRSPRGTGLG